jgi:hypothetical protein
MSTIQDALPEKSEKKNLILSTDTTRINVSAMMNDDDRKRVKLALVNGQ